MILIIKCLSVTNNLSTPLIQNSDCRVIMKTDTPLNALLNRSLTIRKQTIANRLVLAPLSKIGNVAFRQIVSEFGDCGLLFTEMNGARSIPPTHGRTTDGFMWRKEELPKLVCQIFGNEPEKMAIAARRIESEGFFGVDINLGCSVAAFCKRGYGAALLKNPPLVSRILRAIRDAVNIPVFAKFRTGWEDNPEKAVEMAIRLEDGGADALTFHPRVAPDRRTRPPKWEYIGRVTEAVGIPVFGNGDVFSENDCLKMMQTTGCDGVALGRIAVAQPWVFAQWISGFHPGRNIYFETALRLLRYSVEYFGPEIAIRRFHRFSSYFCANFKFGHTLLSQLSGAAGPTQIAMVLERFFHEPPELVTCPNITIFR